MKYKQEEQGLFHFHLSNLEFACGAKLDKVSICMLYYLNDVISLWIKLWWHHVILQYIPYMYNFIRDVICEVFTVNWSSEKLSSLTKLCLASAGEQDTCEWLHMALAKDDGKF